MTTMLQKTKGIVLSVHHLRDIYTYIYVCVSEEIAEFQQTSSEMLSNNPSLRVPLTS